MIAESSYWKNDLLKRTAYLRKRMVQKRWVEASHSKFEQALMLGFYSVRKLIEAKKLSNLIADRTITLVAFPALNKPVTHMNWHKIDELYDMESGANCSITLGFLCNQFVHSYVFVPVFDEDSQTVCQVLVSSGFERNRRLYQVDLAAVVAMFEQIGGDYPNEARMVFNPKIKDYE